MLLERVDVRISTPNSRRQVVITTTDEAYDTVKKILLELKDSTGLPVVLISEESAAAILKMREEGKSDYSIQIKTDVEVPRNTENKFLILAWQINLSLEQLPDLTLELQSHFVNFGLSCKIF